MSEHDSDYVIFERMMNMILSEDWLDKSISSVKGTARSWITPENDEIDKLYSRWVRANPGRAKKIQDG